VTSSLEINVKLLGIVRKIYPDARGVIVVSGSIYQHIFDGNLEVTSVKS